MGRVGAGYAWARGVPVTLGLRLAEVHWVGKNRNLPLSAIDKEGLIG